MFYVKFFIMITCGLAAGIVTAAAYVAFISMLGMFPKFAQRTKTGRACLLYENCLMLGILFATFLQFFLTYNSSGLDASKLPPTAFSYCFLSILGIFGGIYTGFLIGGLSEVLNVIPIYARKTRTTKQIKYAIISLALGKGFFFLIESITSYIH